MAFLSVNLPEPGFRFFAAPGWFALAVPDPVTPGGTKPLYEVEPPPPFEEATVPACRDASETSPCRRAGDSRQRARLRKDDGFGKATAELPSQAPAGLSGQLKTARAKMETAYEAAVKEYTKANKDERADAAEKALAEFRKGDTGPKGGGPVADRDRLYWETPSGYFLKGPGKDWFEKWDAGRQTPNLFQEVVRTADYIELRHYLVPVTYRLYNDRATIKDERLSAEFKPTYVGGGWRAPRK